MSSREPIEHEFSSVLDTRYLQIEPEGLHAVSPLVVALHGYASHPLAMLRLVENWFPDALIASIQAPSAFFLQRPEDRAKERSKDQHTKPQVGYSWATHNHSASAVRLHHDMVRHVLEEVGQRHGVPVSRRFLIGFSQSVGLNYRLIATHPGLVRGVIAVCGGVPGNWETGDYHAVDAAVLHYSRTEDEFYPIETARTFPDRLRLRAKDVEYCELQGGHRFPSAGKASAREWLRRRLDGTG